MELISIGKFAEMVGLSIVTPRRMHKSGELVPCHISKGSTRYYSTEQLRESTHIKDTDKLVIGYCRVSTPSQKNDLEKQDEVKKNAESN